jgi:hypothetical protein
MFITIYFIKVSHEYGLIKVLVFNFFYTESCMYVSGALSLLGIYCFIAQRVSVCR